MNTSPNEIQSSSFFSILTCGLVTGSLQVVLSVSYAALVYGGQLSFYSAQGIGFALLGALITATSIALFSALPGTVGSNQDVSVAIFSFISLSIVASMPPGTNLENTFYTVALTISITVLLTGLFFLGLGAFDLGGLIRYLPYPVVGGFLAGTGWLLFTGGFSLTVETENFKEFFQSHLLVRWLPGLLFSFILLVVSKRYRNSIILPGIIFSGFFLFYGAAWHLDYSIDDLLKNRWLLGPFPEQNLWKPISVTNLSMVEWNVIKNQAANIVTVMAVSSLTLLLNASAMELETKKDIDLNKELRLAGITNLLSCLSPGFVGFRQLSLTNLNFRMGAQSRITGLIGASVIALTLFWGISLVSYLPKVIMGGILMYLGLTFLVEWAYETWFTLPKIDFAIIWLVLLVIATFGFMPGVGIGLVAAIIMFVVSYSRAEAVRYELTENNYQGLFSGNSDPSLIVEKEKECIYILQLQGFIFFGTAHRLFEQLKKKIDCISIYEDNFIILDFQRVDVLDSTGMLSFKKLKNLINISHTHLIITAPNSKIHQQLINGGLSSSHPLIHYFPNLNAGVKWCNKKRGKQTSKHLCDPPSTTERLFINYPKEMDLSQLLQYFERIEVESETCIFKQGTFADTFFFVESGHVEERGETQLHESILQIETMENGHFIGYIEFYLGLPRAVDVCATERCIVYQMSNKRLRLLEKENPEISVMLHQMLIFLLSERVTHLAKKIHALQCKKSRTNSS